MDVDNLIKQGMAAIKAGDKDKARKLLQQAVDQEPENAKAWYFLAGAESSVAARRTALEKVLEIKPDNTQAKEQLEKLSHQEEPVNTVAEAVESTTQTTTAETKDAMDDARDKAEDVLDDVKERVSAMGQEGIDLPVDIPGKPDHITPQIMIETFMEILKNGFAILQRKPGIYPAEVQHASWWRFWVFVGGVTFVTAIATTISGIMVQNQLASTFGALGIEYTPPGIFNILITFVLAIPIGIAILYAGIYASHSFVTKNRDGQGSLVNHAYAIILPVTTASLIGNLLGLVFSILPFGGLVGLVTIVISIYSWYIAHGGIKMVHKVETNTATWTLIVLIVAEVAVAIVIGIILGPILLTSGAMAFF